MDIKDLMKPVYILDKDIPLAEAADIMSSKGFSSIVYVKDKRIAGIITERDLLKNFDKEGTVSQIMTKKVITIDSDSDVEEALDLMKKYEIKKLPVIEKGKLVGIIKLIDIARHVDEVDEDFFF